MQNDKKPFAVFLTVQQPGGEIQVISRIYENPHMTPPTNILGRFNEDELELAEELRDKAEYDYYGEADRELG